MSPWGRGRPCCPGDAGDGASNRNIGVRTRGSESHGKVWPVFIRLRGPQGQTSPQGKVQLRRAGTCLVGHARPSTPHWVAHGQNRSVWMALVPADSGSPRRGRDRPYSELCRSPLRL